MPTPTSELPSDSSLLDSVPDTDCPTLSQPLSCTNLEPPLDTKPITEENGTEIQQTCRAKIYAPHTFYGTEDTLLEAFIEENPHAGILTVKWFWKNTIPPANAIKVKFKGTKPPHEIYYLEDPYQLQTL